MVTVNRQLSWQAFWSGQLLLIRLFALVAFLFGLLHLGDGLLSLITTLSGRHSFFILQIQLAILFFDLLFGVGSLVIAVGLFLRKELAREAWLVFLILMLLVWLHLTAMKFFAGYSGLGGIYRWIGMLVLVSIISWAYLSKAAIKARFH